jgi:hypothetical protein
MLIEKAGDESSWESDGVIINSITGGASIPRPAVMEINSVRCVTRSLGNGKRK